MQWGSGDYLSPRLLQSVGLLLLIGSVIFWAATGRESVLMVSSAMTLIGGGALRGAWAATKAAATDETTER